MRHISVLREEVIKALCLKPGMNVVDCTLGDGGHAEQILSSISPHGKLFGIDADKESLKRSIQNLKLFKNQSIFVHTNFVHLKKSIDKYNFYPVQAILIDLGWSSPQFKERNRGFSFENSEPLDMRYDTLDKSLETAAEVVGTLSIEELQHIFHAYGEEKFSKEIAEAIVLYRKKNSLKTTGELVDIILGVYRKKLHSSKPIPWVGGLHPATKIFQALRIVVNKELEVLKQVLPQAVEILSPGGRLAVITFHSLEDRIVKHFFKTVSVKQFNLITKKPVTASEKELHYNPRARSAKLRVLEKK